MGTEAASAMEMRMPALLTEPGTKSHEISGLEEGLLHTSTLIPTILCSKLQFSTSDERKTR
jgi:hypothetical protein